MCTAPVHRLNLSPHLSQLQRKQHTHTHTHTHTYTYTHTHTHTHTKKHTHTTTTQGTHTETTHNCCFFTQIIRPRLVIRKNKYVVVFCLFTKILLEVVMNSITCYNWGV